MQETIRGVKNQAGNQQDDILPAPALSQPIDQQAGKEKNPKNQWSKTHFSINSLTRISTFFIDTKLTNETNEYVIINFCYGAFLDFCSN